MQDVKRQQVSDLLFQLYSQRAQVAWALQQEVRAWDLQHRLSADGLVSARGKRHGGALHPPPSWGPANMSRGLLCRLLCIWMSTCFFTIPCRPVPPGDGLERGVMHKLLPPQEMADDMLQRANELAGNELLSGRQAVKLSVGLAHVLVVEVRLPVL